MPATPEQEEARKRIIAGLDTAEAFLDKLIEIESYDSNIKPDFGIDMLYVIPRPQNRNATGLKSPYITTEGLTVPNSTQIDGFDDVCQIHVGRVNGSTVVAFSPKFSSYRNMRTSGVPKESEEDKQVVIVRDSLEKITINGQELEKGILDDALEGGFDFTGRPIREPLGERFEQLMGGMSQADTTPLIRDLKQFEASEQHAKKLKGAQEIEKLVYGAS